MTKPIIVEMFDPEFIELQRELSTGYHPKLEPLLSRINPNEIEMKIMQIASYCGIILDGIYTLEDRVKLCEILRQRLILLRENPNKSIVLVN